MGKTPRQTQPVRARRANVAWTGEDARDAEEAKAAFLEAFGHGSDYHARFDMDTAGPAIAGAITAKRALAAGLTDITHGCGWWFCAAPADSVDWREMGKAHGCLAREGIDPHGPHVAELGKAFALVREWSKEREHYEALRESLRALREKLPRTSDAERLRLKWLEEIRPLHRNAFAAKPLDDRNANRARQAAMELARSWGWNHSVVAAVLVLTGAEKLTADRDFKAIKDEVRKAYARLVKAPK